MKTTISFFNCLIISSMLMTATAPTLADALGDIIYDREDQSDIESFPPSIFPHWRHRIHYRCDTCHDSLFKMKRGGTPVTMELIEKGELCGTCHNGKIAFGDSFEFCIRCHQAPSE